MEKPRNILLGEIVQFNKEIQFDFPVNLGQIDHRNKSVKPGQTDQIFGFPAADS